MASNSGNTRTGASPIGIWRKDVKVEEITAAFNNSPSLLNELGLLSSSNSFKDCLGTPLFAAAMNGNFVIAAELVKYKVEIDAATILREDASSFSFARAKWTPLHVAIEGGHANIVKLLVENGAHICRQTNVSSLVNTSSLDMCAGWVVPDNGFY